MYVLALSEADHFGLSIKESNMEAYATLKDTLAALQSIGFSKIDEVNGHVYMDSPKGTNMGAVAQLHVCQLARSKYWVVDVTTAEIVNGFVAPVVWEGPKAQWDNSKPLDEFVEWLDEYAPGWR